MRRQRRRGADRDGPDGLDGIVDRIAGKRIFGVYPTAEPDAFLTVAFEQGAERLEMLLISIRRSRIVGYSGVCGGYQTPEEWAAALGLGEALSAP